MQKLRLPDIRVSLPYSQLFRFHGRLTLFVLLNGLIIFCRKGGVESEGYRCRVYSEVPSGAKAPVSYRQGGGTCG